MGEFIKWALLVVGIIALIALVVALPFTGFLDVGEFGSLITQLVDIVGSFLLTARQLINNFLTPFGITVLSGLLIYIIGKWVITIGIKITAWIYHFIFK